MNYTQMPLKYPNNNNKSSLTNSNLNHTISQSQQQTLINTVQNLSPPQQSSSSSKLHKYFGSSQYLSTQQQLSVFIQGFPLIDIRSQHKSINEIIPLLIKQNQLLGKKCHSQVLLIKESFSKHQSINKQYKSMKLQLQSTRTQCQSIIKEKDQQIVKINSQIDQFNRSIRIYQQFIVTQNSIFGQLLSGEFKKVEEMISTRAVKDKYQGFVGMVNKINYQQSQSLSLPLSPIITQASFLSLATIQKHNKQNKRRVKYYSKVKQSVEQFCSRLIKIAQIVPPQIIIRQLKYECEQFVDVVGELINIGNGDVKKKREKSQAYIRVNELQRQSMLGSKLRYQQHQSLQSSSLLMNSPKFMQRQTISLRNNNNSGSSFQLMLSCFIQQTVKKYSQQISLLQIQLQQSQQQLVKVKQQQQTTKQYYQSHLIQTKLQYEKQKRTFDQQTTIKDEMIRHFQQQLQKCFALKQQLQNKLQLYIKENQQMKQQYHPKVREIQMLQEQLQSNQQTKNKLRERVKLVQHQNNQLINNKQQQHKQAIHKIQQKLKQQQQQHQQQLITKLNITKQKQQQIQLLNSQIRMLKQQIQDKSVEVNRLNKKLLAIQNQQVKTLQNKIQSIEKQTIQTKKTNKQLQKTIQQLHHQITLNTSYIQQLQAKTQKKDQAIERLNKKLSTVQMDKKGINKMKQANQLFQQQINQQSNQLSKALQQNSNLKKLVKQMKKQLQSVYHTINDLKTIEKDREKLVLESQKSQRWREQIIKDYDEMKFQILKVESENKSLALEVRHYKNALKRIQMIN